MILLLTPPIAEALNDALMSNSMGLGVSYSESDWRYALAIADAIQNNPQNLALYTDTHWRVGLAIANALNNTNSGLNVIYSDFEYRYGLAIADIVSGKAPNFAAYTQSELLLAEAISPILLKYFSMATPVTGTGTREAVTASSAIAPNRFNPISVLTFVNRLVETAFSLSLVLEDAKGIAIAQGIIETAFSPTTAFDAGMTTAMIDLLVETAFSLSAASSADMSVAMVDLRGDTAIALSRALSVKSTPNAIRSVSTANPSSVASSATYLSGAMRVNTAPSSSTAPSVTLRLNARRNVNTATASSSASSGGASVPSGSFLGGLVG